MTLAHQYCLPRGDGEPRGIPLFRWHFTKDLAASASLSLQSSQWDPRTGLRNYNRAWGPFPAGQAAKGSEGATACSLPSSGPREHIQPKSLLVLPERLSDKRPAAPRSQTLSYLKKKIGESLLLSGNCYLLGEGQLARTQL